MFRYLVILCLLVRPLSAADERPLVTHAVLVHGIWESGKYTFVDLRSQLEASGVKVLIPRLRPATAHHGLMPLAKQLKSEIHDAFGPKQPFLLIGFSMGGIVGRTYLQELGGHDRCQAFVTISSPHQGTRTASLHPGKGTEDMRPGSELLTRLADTEDILGDLPAIAYRTPMDLVIRPTRNAMWDRAENIVIHCPFHAMMSDSEHVRDDLLPRFRFPQIAPETRKRLIKGPPHRR
ncbi:MAG: esterase/lipase family protein [Haloferula sp.]